MNTGVLLLAAMLTVVVLCFVYVVRSITGLRSRQRQAEAVARAKMTKVLQAHANKGKERKR